MKTPVAAVVFALVCTLVAFAAFLRSLPWGGLRGWWNDRVTVFRLRAEWKRRKRAFQAAQRALDPDHLFGKQAREQARAVDIGIAVGLALAVVAVLLLHGCGGRYPIDDAPADAGGGEVHSESPGVDAGAPEVHEPQCQDLQQGQEFFAADTSAEVARLILNDLGCLKFCRNTAGGATCVSAQNTLVRCAACQGVSP